MRKIEQIQDGLWTWTNLLGGTGARLYANCASAARNL